MVSNLKENKNHLQEGSSGYSQVAWKKGWAKSSFRGGHLPHCEMHLFTAIEMPGIFVLNS
jgi:hypothetical protein